MQLFLIRFIGGTCIHKWLEMNSACRFIGGTIHKWLEINSACKFFKMPSQNKNGWNFLIYRGIILSIIMTYGEWQ